LSDLNLLSDKVSNLVDLKKEDSIYIGIDPTAPNIHLGTLYTILISDFISEFTGARLICLMGGFTASIGDLSDKDERPILTNQEIALNTDKIKSVVSKLLKRNALFVDNSE